MKAYVFPGQGAQYPGMGKDLYENSAEARALFEKANEILGFDITKIMFEGGVEEMKLTKDTQPAIFLHTVILAKTMGEKFKPDMVAGHSVGEFAALVTAGAMSFEDGLRLVAKRAKAMQDACDIVPSSMAAIIGMDDSIVEEVCESIDEIVVAANYNCPGQLVISGTTIGVEKACSILTVKGAKRTIKLKVAGAFHSPLMELVRDELVEGIKNTIFTKPVCPVYQNVNALATSDLEAIKQNLIAQLTAPVKWTQTVQNMIADGATSFTEIGPGTVLQGLVKKVDRNIATAGVHSYQG